VWSGAGTRMWLGRLAAVSLDSRTHPTCASAGRTKNRVTQEGFPFEDRSSFLTPGPSVP
jgi:hypothetical protein